jgi:hypothetical protein
MHGGFSLNDEGKKLRITEVNNKLEYKRHLNSKKMKVRNVKLAEIHKIVKEIGRFI